MLAGLVSSFFAWLPLALWMPVWFVIAISLLTFFIRVISIIADVLMHIIDIFI